MATLSTTKTKTGTEATLKEDCTIETSTLHYLDLRYGVCLYFYRKDTLKFDKTSDKVALFRSNWGTIRCKQITLYKDDFTCKIQKEWRLVISGKEKILSSETYDFSPFPDVMRAPQTLGSGATTTKSASGSMIGALQGSGGNLYVSPDYVPDMKTRMIVCIPQPPSQAMPGSDDINYFGFYDYGHLPGEESELNMLDGGNQDMFYPEWCRMLQPDPVWRAIADRRYAISWSHDDLITEAPYTPPAPMVSPIPIGSFARHPMIGDIYQFLVEKGSSPMISTSPELTAMTDKQLALTPVRDSSGKVELDKEGKAVTLKTHDTTLYYPIGVV